VYSRTEYCLIAIDQMGMKSGSLPTFSLRSDIEVDRNVKSCWQRGSAGPGTTASTVVSPSEFAQAGNRANPVPSECDVHVVIRLALELTSERVAPSGLSIDLTTLQFSLVWLLSSLIG
jgi:hypothetical protein